ncbi:MAG TPA: class I SAM-dependent methyltransferase [Candidatus Limnocylindrales bacterium]|nr:class I SAM-dependent methyltransferase [Candidatus Limnocylindrales bacterium]
MDRFTPPTDFDAAASTWHHGLMTRWWSEVNALRPEELAYYRGAIERYGEPALDLGCGTGRLLVALLATGLDVDGLDVSADMLAAARRVGEAHGLAMDGRLARGAFHELAPARRYRTIVCCDSFGIGGSRSADAMALQRVHDALEPDGALVFSIDVLTDAAAAVPADPTVVYPMPWPESRPRARLADGDELELLTRTCAMDAVERVETMEVRIRLWHDDVLVAEEQGRLLSTAYTVTELRAMLVDAGFADVVVEGVYSGLPATADDETVVIIARRVS